MKVLDLFSGIGGFSLGLERAGMQTVAFCEIEDYPRRVLAKHWPEVPIYDDVRTLTADRLAADGVAGIDVICGGYPCQPFSLAGKRAGAEDDRHLWPEMFRLLQETRPTWFIGENVAGHISMGLDQVLSDLEDEGYEAQPFVIPACAVGGGHQRYRLWIVANTNSERLEKRRDIEKCINTAAGEATKNKPASRLADMVNSDILSHVGNWPSESMFLRKDHGVSRRMDRIKCLGNAVVPQIPEIIGRAIMELEH